MKSVFYIKSLQFFFVTLLIASCTSTVSLRVLKPAPIDIPNHIQKVGVVNRALPSNNNKVINVFEGVLSSEGVYADRDGSLEAILGFSQIMQGTPRFQTQQLPVSNLTGSGTGSFPPPLDWPTLTRIATEYKMDGIVILEAFDSNAPVNYSTRERTVKVSETQTKKVIDHVATMTVTVTTGWRFYDVKNQRIVDEYRFNDAITYSGTGTNKTLALQNLIVKRDAVKKVGYKAGGVYGYRVAPQYVNVRRVLYTSGDANLKEGYQYSRQNNWEEAAAIWKTSAESNPKLKVAARACLNMAVANEVNGDIDLALVWAKKALNEYNYKAAQSYVNQLIRRKSELKRLDAQMEKN